MMSISIYTYVKNCNFFIEHGCMIYQSPNRHKDAFQTVVSAGLRSINSVVERLLKIRYHNMFS